MECIELESWKTLRGAATSVKSITQLEPGWVDTSRFEDIVVFIAVRGANNPAGSVFLDIQTAPTREELYFASLIGGFGQALSITSGGPPLVLNLGKDFAAVPVSHWLRWQLNTGGTAPGTPWEATFSVWIAGNPRTGAGPLRGPGMPSGGRVRGGSATHGAVGLSAMTGRIWTPGGR